MCEKVVLVAKSSKRVLLKAAESDEICNRAGTLPDLVWDAVRTGKRVGEESTNEMLVRHIAADCRCWIINANKQWTFTQIMEV